MVRPRHDAFRENMESEKKIEEFKAEVLSYYNQFGRRFPWREGCGAWGVLVSEFMLQQTQTERVVPFFERWMKKWPTPEALNAATLEEALAEWVGLGYNRRCRFLKDCGRIIAEERGGQVPATPEDLRLLPGIGEYTSGAIACFAYNYPCVFIETNIRAAVIHFFFSGSEAGKADVEPDLFAPDLRKASVPVVEEASPVATTPAAVPDAAIVPILEAALDRDNPRVWHWALMDYGAHIKKMTVNPNRRSAHYAKQSKFEGSFRQIRGRVVRALIGNGRATVAELLSGTGAKEADLYRALEDLKRESMVSEENGVYRIR
jgi:A/G-specific adenine glycosylase